MSCCNFSGTDNKGYNLDPKTERVVEAIYSDWTEAAGNPSFPMGGPGTFRTGMPKDLSDGGRPQGQGGRSSMGVPVVPGFPTSYRKAEGCSPECTGGQSCVSGACQTTTRLGGTPVVPGFPTSYKNARSGGPIIPGRPDFGGRRTEGMNNINRARGGGPYITTPVLSFDGGAVKQNWIPLVVLGLSLVVGIGISEWATKKYIK